MGADQLDRLAETVQTSRDALSETVQTLRTRLKPEELIDDALAAASVEARRIAQRAGAAASAHPIAVGSAVAAIALALFTSRSLSRARVNLGDDATDYTDYDDSYESAPALPAPDSGTALASNPIAALAAGLALGAVLALTTKS